MQSEKAKELPFGQLFLLGFAIEQSVLGNPDNGTVMGDELVDISHPQCHQPDVAEPALEDEDHVCGFYFDSGGLNTIVVKFDSLIGVVVPNYAVGSDGPGNKAVGQDWFCA